MAKNGWIREYHKDPKGQLKLMDIFYVNGKIKNKHIIKQSRIPISTIKEEIYGYNPQLYTDPAERKKVRDKAIESLNQDYIDQLFAINNAIDFMHTIPEDKIHDYFAYDTVTELIKDFDELKRNTEMSKKELENEILMNTHFDSIKMEHDKYLSQKRTNKMNIEYLDTIPIPVDQSEKSADVTKQNVIESFEKNLKENHDWELKMLNESLEKAKEITNNSKKIEKIKHQIEIENRSYNSLLKSNRGSN